MRDDHSLATKHFKFRKQDEIQPILNLQAAVMQSWPDCGINFDTGGQCLQETV